jgi:hypothetical protein
MWAKTLTANFNRKERNDIRKERKVEGVDL